MRVATWCIGGINSKLRYLRHWLDSRKPDVVALQKTFAATDHFPEDALRQSGYASVVHVRDGEFQNGWGVAVLVRKTLPKPKVLQVGLPGQTELGARFVTVAAGDLEFSSVYAVYGNPAVNRFEGALERKIEWMKQLCEHLDERTNLSRRCVLAGDFNVVSEGPALPRTLNYTSIERDELNKVLCLGLVDLYDLHRHRRPDIGTGFNYGFNTRQPATSRLHRILGTEVVKDQLRDAWVDLEYRKAVKGLPGCAWPQSAPVIVDLSSESI
ncbi:MAG: endonuclease/exonuclease/phosphatase family protein [Bryobacterales bacterium]|nr:endonuclease/exonuclease/phosphatase family protein [Bryobacterales bacterium]